MTRADLHCLSVREWQRLQARREHMHTGAILGALGQRPRSTPALDVAGARRRASMSVREWRRTHAPQLGEYVRARGVGPLQGPFPWWPWARPDLARVYRAVGLTPPPSQAVARAERAEQDPEYAAARAALDEAQDAEIAQRGAAYAVALREHDEAGGWLVAQGLWSEEDLASEIPRGLPDLALPGDPPEHRPYLAVRLWRACCAEPEATRPVAPNERQSGGACGLCARMHLAFGRLPLAVRGRIAASCGTDEKTAREILPLR